jgi:hypothetical protein
MRTSFAQHTKWELGKHASVGLVLGFASDESGGAGYRAAVSGQAARCLADRLMFAVFAAHVSWSEPY